MSSYIVSPRADEDIFEVWRYLYERAGVEIANRVESELYNAFELLSPESPNRTPAFGSHFASRPLPHGLFVHDRLPAKHSARNRAFFRTDVCRSRHNTRGGGTTDCSSRHDSECSAKFAANIPSRIKQSLVDEFHEILELFANATAQDIAVFRIPEDKTQKVVISFSSLCRNCGPWQKW
jgi:plasmid stabilization system protein ParE